VADDIPDEWAEALVRADMTTNDRREMWGGGIYEEWKAKNPTTFRLRLSEAHELLAPVIPLVRADTANQIADALSEAVLQQIEYRQRYGEQANGVYGDAVCHCVAFIRRVGGSP